MRKAIYLYPEYSTIKNNCWDEAAMAENLYILIKKYLNNTLIISP